MAEQTSPQSPREGSAPAKTPTLSWSQPAPVAHTGQKTPPVTPRSPVPQTISQYGRGSLVGSFVAGLIIGVLAGWGWFTVGQGVQNGAAVATSTESGDEHMDESDELPAASADTSPTISVGTQSAGLRVEVSNVVVAKPTWVVIYENRNGAAGNALGAKLFFPRSQGGTTSGTVTLLRGTVAGRTYFAGQNIDNGDNKFSKQTDTAVMGASGNPLLVSFTVN
jgi:hypothetical protein